MGRPLSAQGRAARSMGQALRLQVARRERRLRPAFLRQGRLARRHGRERRPHEPLAMRYQLKAIGPGGGVESIDSQAPDETTAVRQLEGRGYTVLSVRAKHTLGTPWGDRKSTRLNSSHGYISYAVFCLKKKKTVSTSATLRSSPLGATLTRARCSGRRPP